MHLKKLVIPVLVILTVLLTTYAKIVNVQYNQLLESNVIVIKVHVLNTQDVHLTKILMNPNLPVGYMVHLVMETPFIFMMENQKKLSKTLVLF